MDPQIQLPVTWTEFLVAHSGGSVSCNVHRPFISNRSLLIRFHPSLTTSQNEDKAESLSNPSKDSITLQFSLLQGYEAGALAPCVLIPARLHSQTPVGW